MDIIPEGREGIINIADNITVYGNDTNRHNLRLLALMKRARDYGLVFNKEKFTISGYSIFGLIYSQTYTTTDFSTTST